MPNKICVYKKVHFFHSFRGFQRDTPHTERKSERKYTKNSLSREMFSLCVCARGSDRKLYISHRTHAKVIYSWRADLRVNLDLGAFFVQFLLVKFLLQINALYGFNELRLHTCAPTKICEVYRWRAPLHLRFKNKLKRINKFMNNVCVRCVCVCILSILTQSLDHH